MSLWIRLRRIVRFNYLKLIRLKTSAHSIAIGSAIGIFIGFMPIIPFQSISALFLAVIFRGNKIAALALTWISNAANLIPFYYMLYMVGSFVLPVEVAFDPHHLTMRELFAQGWGVFSVMCAGGVLLGIPGSVLTYFITLRAVLGYRKRKALRMLKRRTGH